MLPALAALAIDLVPRAIDWFTDDDSKTAKITTEVINIAKEVTGLDTSDEKELTEALKADPDKLLAYKQSLLKDKYRLDEMFLEDKKDARDMYESTSHETADEIAKQVMTWNLPMIVAVAAFQIMILTVIPIWVPIDAAVSGIIGNVCGWIIKGLFDERAQICGFFYGSSQGSKDKTKAMNGGVV